MLRVELARLLRLSIPIIFAQLSQMGMGVADAMMAGRVSAVDLAGITLGGNLYWPLLFLVAGIVMAVTPTVSQLHGRGQSPEAGEIVRQALWIALLGGCVLILCMNNAEPVYRRIGVDPVAIPVATAYLNALSFGVLPVLGYFALRYLCEGLSWTTPAMVIALGALITKIGLNYVLIHGKLGMPALGGVGCGWASAIVATGQLVAMVLVVRFSRIRISGLFDRFSPPHWPTIRRLVKLGVPIGLATSLEMAVFSATTLMIGTLGVTQVAAHQIAMNIGGLAFMLPLALGMAASIRVGFNVGSGDIAAARRSGWVAIGLSAAFAFLAAGMIFWGRSALAGLYTNEPEVLALASQLLVFVAVFQLFDDTQGTAIGALRGFKDTRTPAATALVAYWLIGFPVGVTLGFGGFGLPALGVQGFWIGLTLGLAVAAVTLLSRFQWLSRREYRVEELAQR